MQECKFEIINARFIASGVAIQAKGLAYRLRPNKGRDAQKNEDYKLGTLPGYAMGGGTTEGGAAINKAEEKWSGSGDYWLGRTALTDMVVKVPDEGLLLINDATVNVSLQKEVVKTALVGRAGTIKEYITDGDYQLSISVGIVAVDDDGRICDQYPERAVAQLREIMERPEALEVSSAFLDLFGISHIVVTGFSAKQMTHSNRQVIEITALSDTEYVIESNDY
jgi:hypothetical protein